jgi:hypothetical protein
LATNKQQGSDLKRSNRRSDGVYITPKLQGFLPQAAAAASIATKSSSSETHDARHDRFQTLTPKRDCEGAKRLRTAPRQSKHNNTHQSSWGLKHDVNGRQLQANEWSKGRMRLVGLCLIALVWNSEKCQPNMTTLVRMKLKITK